MANTTGIKYGGRRKGTPNRITKELRTVRRFMRLGKKTFPEALLQKNTCGEKTKLRAGN